MIEAFKKFSKVAKISIISILGLAGLFYIIAVAVIFSGNFMAALIMFGLGIVFTIAALIVIAIQYMHSKSQALDLMKELPKIIEQEGETSIPALAKKYNVSEGQARHAAFECFRKNLIPGYTLSGDNIQRLVTKAEKQKIENTSVITCTGCGANFSSSAVVKECPYCGHKYK